MNLSYIKERIAVLRYCTKGQALAETAVVLFSASLLIEGLLYFGSISDALFEADQISRNEAWSGIKTNSDKDLFNWAGPIGMKKFLETGREEGGTNEDGNIAVRDWHDYLNFPLNFVNGTSKGDHTASTNRKIFGQSQSFFRRLYVNRHTWSVSDVKALLDFRKILWSKIKDENKEGLDGCIEAVGDGKSGNF